MYNLFMDNFEKLVEDALNHIPSFFSEKLENVDLVIENWPSVNQSKGKLLLGLYQGVPKTKRGSNYNMVLPDKITIFQGPIEMVAKGNPESIKKLVIDTVQHEIAHHFGISDRRLDELKYKT